MKYAIISDIHGNAPALRLALDDARTQGAEGFLFAGDYVISAPWSNEVIHLLKHTPSAHFIRGNDEDHLNVPDGDDGQYEVSRWCAGNLTPENRRWLDTLPQQITVSCGNVVIRMAHSSEAFVGKSLHERFRTSILPSRYPDGPVCRDTLLQDFRSLWEGDAFRRHIQRLPKGVYVFGHNHIQTWADYDGRILINPGSCGLPLDCGRFGAAYTLLTIENGRCSVEERRVPYDVEALISQVKRTGQYQSARVWSETIFSEWRTCREKVFFLLQHAEEYAFRIGDPRRPFARETWEAAYADFHAVSPEQYPYLYV
ncbi:MAG: metallophosphoesterase family protein [Clostridia bacterium]|nr:metallophosphoesterase family protein [Clostridia bacterium]